MADAEGWYGLWFADHYMPNTGNETIQPGDVHECWAMLPAIAAVTERIRIGPLVVADIGPSPGRARQPRGDDRPHLERPHGARHRRRLADQRAPRVRHRSRGTGAARRPASTRRSRSSDRCSARNEPTSAASTTRSPTRRPTRSRCSRRCRSSSARAARGCCGSRPDTPTNGTPGARPEMAGGALDKFARRLRTGRPRSRHDVEVGAGARVHVRQCRAGRQHPWRRRWGRARSSGRTTNSSTSSVSTPSSDSTSSSSRTSRSAAPSRNASRGYRALQADIIAQL